jgi:hypothetical protein
MQQAISQPGKLLSLPAFGGAGNDQKTRNLRAVRLLLIHDGEKTEGQGAGTD